MGAEGAFLGTLWTSESMRATNQLQLDTVLPPSLTVCRQSVMSSVLSLEILDGTTRIDYTQCPGW